MVREIPAGLKQVRDIRRQTRQIGQEAEKLQQDVLVFQKEQEQLSEQEKTLKENYQAFQNTLFRPNLSERYVKTQQLSFQSQEQALQQRAEQLEQKRTSLIGRQQNIERQAGIINLKAKQVERQQEEEYLQNEGYTTQSITQTLRPVTIIKDESGKVLNPNYIPAPQFVVSKVIPLGLKERVGEVTGTSLGLTKTKPTFNLSEIRQQLGFTRETRDSFNVDFVRKTQIFGENQLKEAQAVGVRASLITETLFQPISQQQQRNKINNILRTQFLERPQIREKEVLYYTEQGTPQYREDLSKEGGVLVDLAVSEKTIGLGFKISKPVINQFYKTREFTAIREPSSYTAELKEVRRGLGQIKISSRVRATGGKIPVYNVRETITPFRTTTKVTKIGEIDALARINVVKNLRAVERSSSSVYGNARIKGDTINVRKLKFSGKGEPSISKTTLTKTGEDYALIVKQQYKRINSRVYERVIKLEGLKGKSKFPEVQREIRLLTKRRGLKTEVFRVKELEANAYSRYTGKPLLRSFKSKGEVNLIVETPSTISQPKIRLFDPIKAYKRPRVSRAKVTLENIRKTSASRGYDVSRKEINRLAEQYPQLSQKAVEDSVKVSAGAGQSAIRTLLSKVKASPIKDTAQKVLMQQKGILATSTRVIQRVQQRLDVRTAQRNLQRIGQRIENRVGTRSQVRQSQRLSLRQQQRLEQRQVDRVTTDVTIPKVNLPPSEPVIKPFPFLDLPEPRKKKKKGKRRLTRFEREFGITPTLFEETFLTKYPKIRKTTLRLKEPKEFTGLEVARLRRIR